MASTLHSDAMPDVGPFQYQLRSFRAADLDACQRLYREGILSGRLAENDSGLDIDDIDSAYMKPHGNHFWVAESEGKIVGMIGVILSDGTGEIRRLRVADGYRGHKLGSTLLENSVRFCRENNYLKVALDTHIDRETALKIFEAQHFKLGTTRTYNGKDLMVFYLDLYSGESKSGDS